MPLLFVLLGLPMQAQGATPGVYTDLGTLPGDTESSATGVSSDGSVVVGWSYYWQDFNSTIWHPFRWTAAGGMADITPIDGARYYPSGVSGDGNVVVGFTIDPWRAFRWTAAEGVVYLGTLGYSSYASAVNTDGSVVVGYSGTDLGFRAFRWTSAGMVNLGVLATGDYSTAQGVSSDGSVVVGWSSTSPNANSRAFRWTTAAGPNGGGTMTDLGTLAGGTYSEARGVSHDGSVVVGHAGTTSGHGHAFRWTTTPGPNGGGTMTDLGTLNGLGHSSASAVSGDGRVVVGTLSNGSDINRLDYAFRWTEATGMQTVEQWLRDSGVTVGESMTASSADAVNADGSVVVGTLSNGHAFYARARSGLITIDDLYSSLLGTCPTPTLAMTPASLVLHGVHSRPLSRRVAPGKNTFWTSGDLGRDDHGANDGDTGLMEFGLGHNFGPFQVNLALGRAWANQNLNFDGNANVSGTYAQGDVLVPLRGNLWGVLGGFYMGGTAEVRRGYDNAGTTDFSDGRASTSTWGLRGRLEWDKAASVGQLTVSPYGELSHLRTQIDGYTETSGGFPAVFNSREETATEVRVGADLEYPLFVQTKLIGLMEGVHRFEQDGARVSGTVTGLSSFDFAGVQNTQNWLRFGAGFETAMAGGKLALMVNTTTRGQAANLWGNLTWSMEF